MIAKTSAVLLAAVALTALAGCKKNYPKPYDDIGLSREGLVSAFEKDHGVVGLYNNDKKAAAVADDCEKGLADTGGYKRFCEITFSDKSFARGYKKDKSHRFLMVGHELGSAGPEISITDIPEKIEDDDVCVDPGS